MRRRSWVVALLFVSVALISTPASARGPRVQTFELVRTTTGPASFHFGVQGSPSPSQPHGLHATTAARILQGRVVSAASLGAYAFEYDYGIQAKASGQQVSVCQSLGGCIVNRVLGYSAAVEYADKGESDVFNRFYVVEEGDATISFRAKGWVLLRVPLSFRYITDNTADSDGAFTGDQGYEVFRSAATGGGAFGSIATGAPPCSQSVPGLGTSPPRGFGTATLEGGAKPSSLTCPANIGAPFLTDFTGKATHWRLSGPVIGDTSQLHISLFVVDLPRIP